MSMRSVIGACLSAALACGSVQDARAQDAVEPGAAVPATETATGTAAAGSVQAPPVLVDSASPFGAVSVAEDEVARMTMPELAFDPTPEDQKSFDKYYYFNRPGTDFATAYADISECDGYARGLSSGIAYQQPPYPYAGTMAGAVGGILGNAIANAIAGSAEKRRMRRVNMRKCMNFKGYERYGLSKARWEPFNFEEGLTSVKDEERQRCLKQQALVASSYKPTTKGLGL